MASAETEEDASDGNRVRVAVRCRPFNPREEALASTSCVRMSDAKTTITHPTTGAETTFTFDHSFWSHDRSPDAPPFATQASVFDAVGAEVLESAWKGYNVCLFAYGQTGSGKSFSMVGPPDGSSSTEDEGIVPRACREIFKRLEKAERERNVSWSVDVTMIEIYDEKVYDLLVSAETNKEAEANALDSEFNGKPVARRRNALKVRQHPIKGPYVEGLEPKTASSYEAIAALMATGERNRTVAATGMNETSSRAHTVVELTVTRVERSPCETEDVETRSRVSLVDLAGSERVDGTGATGARLKEGAAINKSLSALGNCIAALAEKSAKKKKKANGAAEKLVPYRDSVLTSLLRDCLGGNARCVMIAALSPASVNYDETLSTLRFADRARNIVSTATVHRESAIPGAAEARIRAQALEAVREARGGDERGGEVGSSGTSSIDPTLEKDLERAIALAEEATEMAEDFDVGVAFKPTLVDAQSAILRIRAARGDGEGDGASFEHALEVAIDVHWHDTGRKSVWPVASLASRLEDWREVYRAWSEGELFTSEAADALRFGAKQEVSTEMRKLGVAHLSTEPLAYCLDTETAYPAIVGPDGERRGTLEVSAVPCTRDGAPLGESAATDDPETLLGKPLYFLVRVKRATGLPRTAIGPGPAGDEPSADDARTADRPQTGQVTATLRVRYHGDLGPGWGAVHATPPVPVVAVHESKGSARFRGFRGGSGGGTVGGAAAVLRYERTHSCPSVTPEVLGALRDGRVAFDVYLQHDGGAGAGAAASADLARPSTADITRLRRKALETAPPSLIPPKRPPSPVLEAEEEKEEESGASSRDASSDSDSASDSDADADSGSARSYSSYSSYDSEGSFDRDAYEEYWDGEEAKHAVALRSPFKMFPGWGATVSPAPSPGGDAGPRKSPLNESRVAFTDDGEATDVAFIDDALEATTLDTLANRLEAAIDTPDATPSGSPAPGGKSKPGSARASPSAMSPLRMVASALSSPVGVKSPLHKGKVAVDGVVDVRGGAVVAERHDTKPKAVARQPRDLAEKPKEPKPEHAPAPKPPPPREPTGFGVASFLRLGKKKK